MPLVAFVLLLPVLPLQLTLLNFGARNGYNLRCQLLEFIEGCFVARFLWFRHAE